MVGAQVCEWGGGGGEFDIECSTETEHKKLQAGIEEEKQKAKPLNLT